MQKHTCAFFQPQALGKLNPDEAHDVRQSNTRKQVSYVTVTHWTGFSRPQWLQSLFLNGIFEHEVITEP
jgi:hypothetical protein